MILAARMAYAWSSCEKTKSKGLPHTAKIPDLLARQRRIYSIASSMIRDRYTKH